MSVLHLVVSSLPINGTPLTTLYKEVYVAMSYKIIRTCRQIHNYNGLYCIIKDLNIGNNWFCISPIIVNTWSFRHDGSSFTRAIHSFDGDQSVGHYFANKLQLTFNEKSVLLCEISWPKFNTAFPSTTHLATVFALT